MKREYNNKISEKANKSLAKRAYIVRMEKTIIAAIFIIAISIIILLSSTIHAFADSKDKAPVNKYYTSIQISSGDTLWSIADKYTKGTNIDKNEYIEEITSINNINDQIHSGDHIIVAYYSTDIK